MPPSFKERLSSITLGTAQFGLPYGVANRAGMPDVAAVHATLDDALAHGITCVDTAAAYGVAEQRLGDYFVQRGGAVPLIVTKLDGLADIEDPAGAARARLAASLRRLRRPSIAAYLLHRAADMDEPRVWDALAAAQSDGLVGEIGVSVYEPAEFEAALARPAVTIIQAPCNAFDRRLVDRGLLRAAQSRGVTVFARSVFLQGLFFLDPNVLPTKLSVAAPALRQIQAIARDSGFPLAHILMSAVLSLGGIDSIVVGVNTPAQLREICATCDVTVPGDIVASVVAAGAGLLPHISDPRQW